MRRGKALIAVTLAVLTACAGDDASPPVVPSQTVAAAARDHVVPALAALPVKVRSDRRATLRAGADRWVISGPSTALYEAGNQNTCGLGDESGEFGVDFICTSEYGEVLLLDDRDRVRRAYPMPSVPPSWLYATDDAVYGGRVGDGCAPDSTLFRIDRDTLQHDLIVFHEGDLDSATLLPGWRLATVEEAARFEGVVGGDAGVEVTSAIGTLRVDIDRVSEFFDRDDSGAPATSESNC